jgi:GMP synthase-like glutamine amidotransferase
MPKDVLILRHIEIEGPGSIGDFFKNTTWNLKTVDLSKEESLPGSFKNIKAIISLGGPMNVYEEDKYRFLKDETEFLQGAIQKEVPILGVCLGAQLLAKACGAKIAKAPASEIGWYKISLTEEGKSDHLFVALPSELMARRYLWYSRRRSPSGRIQVLS